MRAEGVRASLAALSVAGVAACSFDASGLGDGDAGVAPPDGPAPNDGGPSGLCSDDIDPVISADGTTVGAPLVTVLVGDTVRLSAAESCVRDGPASYEWSISPVDPTGDTMLPNARSETITLYPTRPTEYNVTLTVTDASGQHRSLTRFAIESIGWERLEDSADHPLAGEWIRDVAVGQDRLWLTAEAGAFTAPLSDLASSEETGTAFGGEPLAGRFGPVTFGQGAAWLGRQGSLETMWRVVPAQEQLDAIDLGDGYTIRELAAAGSAVAAATSQGALLVDPETGVDLLDGDLDLFAVAARADSIWFGGDRLYRDGAFDRPVDPTDGEAGGGNVITGLDFGPNGELWIATSEHGVVRAVASTGAGEVVYRAGETALPSDDVREVAVERAGRFEGDVWVATAAGAARFKRDRGVWLPMNAKHGLHLRQDMQGIAVAPPSQGRGIYAATMTGVVYLRAP